MAVDRCFLATDACQYLDKISGRYRLEIFKKVIKCAMIKDGVTRKIAQICVVFLCAMK